MLWAIETISSLFVFTKGINKDKKGLELQKVRFDK